MLGVLGVNFLNALFTDDAFFFRYSHMITSERMDGWRAIVLNDNDNPAVDGILSDDAQADVDDAERTLRRIGKVLVFDSAIRHGVMMPAGVAADWDRFVLPLCDDLMQMHSYRPVRLLVVGAIDFLRTTREFEHNDEQALGTMRLLQERLWNIEAVHLDRLGQLASKLGEFRDHNIARACLAATFWTAGDLPRACSIERGMYWPSFRQIRGLLHDALQRLDRDMLTLGVLNRFQGHYGSIDGFERVLTSPPLGMPDELIDTYMHYGENAIMYFARSVNLDHSRELARLFNDHSTMIWASSPSAWLRIAGLLRLIDPLDEQLPTWDHLFTISATELRRTAGPLASVDEYDLSTSFAAFYLNEGGPAIINRLEKNRATPLGYWHYLSPYSPAGADRSSALHHAFLLNRVVQPNRTNQKTLTTFGPPGGPTRIDYSQERARYTSAEFIGELTDELVSLAGENPDIPSPITPASVESFASVLAVHTTPLSQPGE